MLIVAAGQEALYNRDIFSIFLNMKVCCVLIEAILISTHNIPFAIQEENQQLRDFFPKDSRTSSKQP